MRTFAQKQKPIQQAGSSHSAKQGRPFFGQSREIRAILHLQRTIGNRAVERLLQSNGEQREASSASSVSTDFSPNFSRIPPSAGTNVLPKLQVSSPGDVYEQKADRMAERVVSSASVSAVQGQCAACTAGIPCSKCEQGKRFTLKKLPVILRKFPQRDSRNSPFSRGGGQPLPQPVRALFEPHFGYDFSQVRVHTNSRAAEATRSIQARAFTIGQDVVFGAGEYALESREGQKLLAHELTHVVQQTKGISPSTGLIQRQQAGGASLAVEPSAEAQAESPPLRPRPGAEHVWFQDVHLAADREWLRSELRNLIAQGGLKGADLWHEVLLGRRQTIDLPSSAHTRAFGRLGVRTPLDEMREMPEEQATLLVQHLRPLVSEVYQEVRAEAVQFLKDFEKKAKENVLRVLEAHETQVKAEGIRYGITSETVEKIRYRPTYEGPREKVVESETRYDMDRGSPAAKGLQAAAKVLLERRRKIEEREREQQKQYKMEPVPYDRPERTGIVKVPTEEFYTIRKEIEEKKKTYNELRAHLSTEYPTLAAFSDISKGTGDLERIAEKDLGPDTAALIGQKIAEKLANIEKVRKGLRTGNVNVWKLPKIVNVTAIQLGVTTDRTKARLVEDKREAEQPGFWDDVALLVLNIAAIALAAPTGGMSLAVAAGVNVAVAASHVEEYLMQEAMTGTAFDKAQALSQDEPSLLWLAVEIVGTVADVGGAASAMFKTFRSLAPLVKTAQAAKTGEAAVKTLQAVEAAAIAERGAIFAKRLVARIKAIRGGESAALKAARATDEEIKILQAAGKAAEAEAASGIGKALKSVTGEVNISKTGHIWSCASPCTILREKYAEIFAQSDDVSQGFFRELQQLEGEAQKVAKARAVAEASNNADELAKATTLAEKIKTEAVELEMRILQANPAELKREYVKRYGKKLSESAKEALARGYRPTPPGYYWRLNNGRLEVVKQKGTLGSKLVYDPKTHRFVEDPGGPSLAERFADDVTPEDGFRELGGYDAKTAFGKFVKVLNDEFGVPAKKLIDEMDIPGGLTHRTVREKLKKPYVDKLFDRITDRVRLEKTETYSRVLKKTKDESQALRAASHEELISISRRLGSSDKGSLGEKWYEKWFVRGKEKSSQVKLGKQHGIKFEEERRIDIYEEHIAREVKNVTEPMGDREAKQLEDLLTAVGKKIEIKVKDERVQTGFERVQTGFDRVQYVFLDPIGASVNARWMVAQLKKFRNDPISFQILSKDGRPLSIRPTDLLAKGEASLEAAIKAWVE